MYVSEIELVVSPVKSIESLFSPFFVRFVVVESGNLSSWVISRAGFTGLSLLFIFETDRVGREKFPSMRFKDPCWFRAFADIHVRAG